MSLARRGSGLHRRRQACVHAGALVAIICAMVLPGPAALHAQSDAPTDEAGLAQLVRDMAVQTAGSLGERELRVRVLPEDAHPMVLQVFAEECAARGVQLVASATARLTLEVRTLSVTTLPPNGAATTGASGASASTGSSLSPSTASHGNSSYVRRLEAVVGVLAEASDGSVRFAREFRAERADTLTGEAVTAVRDLRIPPSPSWIERALVPVVAATAAVVVAVLLFTVRGS